MFKLYAFLCINTYKFDVITQYFLTYREVN